MPKVKQTKATAVSKSPFAAAAANSKKRTEIVKPAKILREALGKRKKEFEKKGWLFTENPASGKWRAQIVKPEKLGSRRFETEEFDGFNYLLSAVEEFQKSFELELKEVLLGETKRSAEKPSQDDVTVAYETNLLNITPSPFEGQARRRARFTDDEIGELADSIKQQGVIQPIVVRVKSIGAYEIVAGERRFLAAKRAGLKTIPTIIKNVSDQVAFEIQTVENLQRKEPDPLDEAFSYREYIEKYGMTEADLAVKFGKPEKFIAGRLKLNDLIPEALEDIALGFLPLGHAALIAKYTPEIQKEILEDYAYEYGKEDGAVSLQALKEAIKDEITLNLCDAIFSKEAHDLRPDGLACVDCPQRTGWRPMLFTDDVGADDRCLDKTCFELKTTNHMLARRREIAAPVIAGQVAPNPNLSPDQAAQVVPLVAEYYHSGNTEFGKEKVLTYAKFLDEGSCEHLKPALVIDGKRKGETAFICQNKKCPVHGENKPRAEKDAAPSAYELRNKEDNFNREVARAVQSAVVKAASGRFTTFEDFLSEDALIRSLVLNFLTGTSSYTSERVTENFKDVKDFPKNFYSSDYEKHSEFFKTLSTEQIARALFLTALSLRLKSFTYEKLDLTFVRQLAATYTDLNVDLIDAETRVKLAPKEFKSVAEQYRDAVAAGETAEAPRFWWTAEAELAAKESGDFEDDDDDDDDDFDDNDDSFQAEDDDDESDDE